MKRICGVFEDRVLSGELGNPGAIEPNSMRYYPAEQKPQDVFERI